jgi:MFS family permease
VNGDEQRGPGPDALEEFARRRKELDPFLLRAALANALRRRGYGRIVTPEDGGPQEKRQGPFAALLTITMFWTFGASGAIALGSPWYLWPVGMLVAFAVLAMLVKVVPGDSAGSILIFLWVALGLGLAVAGSFATLIVSYGAPLGLLGCYGVATRALRVREAQDLALALGGVIRSAPLVAPLVLAVLFLPALSENVWQVGAKLDPESLLIVGASSVGLLFVLVRLQLGAETEPTISRRASHLCDRPERLELTRSALAAAEQEAASLLETMPEATIEAAWPSAGEEYGPYLSAAVGKTLRSPLTGRLALTIGVVAVLFTGYVYLLCAAVVPSDLAESWTGSAVPSAHVKFLGAEMTFHGGAFINLSALMGLAATATFLSFALIEERFAKALAGALLQDPTDRFLALGLPYVFLWERATEEGRAARQAEASPAPPSSESR